MGNSGDKMENIIIIGAGPAGISAALYAARGNLTPLLLNNGIGALAKAEKIENYYGLERPLSGEELYERGVAQAKALGIRIIDAQVLGINGFDTFTVQTTAGNFDTVSVILATGGKRSAPNIPGIREFEGKGVSYCAICDGSFYRGKSVAVLGGGDTALDDAVYLADVAEKVYVIHRRKEFRGAAVTVAKLREKENVIFVLEHQVKEIIGEQKVTGVVLEDAAVIDVNGVFVAYGAVPQTDLLKKFAVLDDSGYVRAGETGETALEGLYVAGDARTKKLRQVVTAVSDGANAATAVAEYLK